MSQPELFPRAPTRALSNDELVEALTAAMAPGIRHCREADLYLVTICAREVANRLMYSGVRWLRRRNAHCPPAEVKIAGV